MLTRRPARPAPPPKRDISRRLEEVRAHTGYPSLRSFWARLAEDWTDEKARVSYEAARNYHYDRDPPVSYLVRVSEVFNVSLEYLATGLGALESGPEIEDYVAKAFGAKSSDEAAQAYRVYTAFQEGAGSQWGEWTETPEGRRRARIDILPLHRGGSPIVLLVGLLRRRQVSRERSQGAVTPEEEIELARELGRAVMAPLEALGVRSGPLYRFFLYEYIESLTPALRRVIEYEDSLQREEQESDE